MNPRAFSAVILTASSLWLAAVPPVAAQEMQRFPVDEDKGSSVEVEHVFSAVPPGGYTAVRITVINKGKEALASKASAFSVTSAGRGEHLMSGGDLAFTAKPESTTTQEWVVPLMTDFAQRSGYNDNNLNIGLGVGGRSVNAVFRSNPFEGAPFSAVSQSLGGVSAPALNDHLRKSRSGTSSYARDSTSIASFLPAHLPADWRAYTGIDLLALNTDEWPALQPGVRTAVRQWIQLGGQLDLYHQGPVPEAILTELKAEPLMSPRPTGGLYSLGSGRIRHFEWDGKELAPELGRRFDTGSNPSLAGGRRERAALIMRKISTKAPRPALVDDLGSRSFAAWQVGVILLLFGLLVGPVNLFYLAGPGRRHRLFVTTPLIALGASVVLVAVIFFSDGAGGQGRRAALIELRPDENTAIVRQFQISRTGVLFGNGFVPAESAVITPLLLENSRWTRLKPPESNEAEGQRFTIADGNNYGGDWFQSRSEQAQLIETIRPGRGRFELEPGGGSPSVVSSYPATVKAFFYQDPAGGWWSAPGPVATGAAVVLGKLPDGEAFREWFKTAMAPFGPGDRSALEDTDHRGRFYAASTDGGAGLVETLSSISWKEDFTLIHGRLAPAPPP